MADAAQRPPVESRRSGAGDRGLRRGVDLGAVVSAAPLMWVALGESSGFLQLLLVGAGVAAFAATRLQLPLPPWPRVRR